jgi:DNA-binding protein HU-beta
MNKGDLVNEVSKVVKTTKDAQAAVDCVLSSITGALREGDSVEIDIAARKVPKFVAGKALKEAVK